MAVRTPIAVAVLVRDGHVLLAHRHPSRRWYPDCWDLLGGHVEPGERPEVAVVRECFEELGVRIRDARPVAISFGDPALDMHAFLVTRWEGEPVNSAPEEHDDLRWFRPGELAELTMADPMALSGILEAIESVAVGVSEDQRT